MRDGFPTETFTVLAESGSLRPYNFTKGRSIVSTSPAARRREQDSREEQGEQREGKREENPGG